MTAIYEANALNEIWYSYERQLIEEDNIREQCSQDRLEVLCHLIHNLHLTAKSNGYYAGATLPDFSLSKIKQHVERCKLAQCGIEQTYVAHKFYFLTQVFRAIWEAFSNFDQGNWYAIDDNTFKVGSVVGYETFGKNAKLMLSFFERYEIKVDVPANYAATITITDEQIKNIYTLIAVKNHTIQQDIVETLQTIYDNINKKKA